MTSFSLAATATQFGLEPLIALMVCMAFAAIYVHRTQRS